MYAISTIPVIHQLTGLAIQVWYADDVDAGGSLLHLKDWWSGLLLFGHHFGYHVNAAKTWLVVKQEHLALLNTSLKVLTFRSRLLVSLIGWTSWLSGLHHKLYTGSRNSVGSRFITFSINCCCATPCCICSSCGRFLVQIELLPLDYSKHS